MRPTSAAVLSAILTGILVGCSGQGSPTPATDTSGPNTDTSPNREPTPKTTPDDSKKTMKVEITKGKLTINGTVVPLFGELAGFEKVLGKPSGTNDGGFYRVVYWKSLGIKGLQDKSGMQQLVTIEFHFQGYDDVLANEKGDPFSGVIMLEGEPITKNTDMNELGQKIKSLKRETVVNWKIVYPDTTTVYIDALLKGVDRITVEKLR